MEAAVEEQLAGGEEGSAAAGAPVGALPGVRQIETRERSQLGEALSAVGARVRALAWAVQVFRLRAFGFKALGALRAAEGSEGGVGELVSPKLPVSQEGLLIGLSPVWVLSWRLRLASWVKPRSQSEHWKGRWPLWLSRCLVRIWS